MSFIDSLKEKFKQREDKAVYLSGFRKSKDSFSGSLNEMSYHFTGVNDAFLEQLTIVLLESDIGIETADLICNKLREKASAYSTVTF